MNLAIIQTRLGSSRFPRKVLKPFGISTILDFLVQRIENSSKIDRYIIATTNLKEDDELIRHCEKKGYEFFRGSENDLLDRHYQCAKELKADSISKIPSDVPFVDPTLIDEVIKLFNSSQFDYVSNLHPPTFPDGLDIETFSFDALEKSWYEASKIHEREHTTPYMWDNPQKFNLGCIKSDEKINYFVKYRWTIDYKEDLLFMNEVYDQFILNNKDFTWKDLISFLEHNPKIYHINRMYHGKNWYGNHLNDLRNFDKNHTITENEK